MEVAAPSPPEIELTPPLVVYDGACGFCRRQVERARRGDPGGVFTFVPRQTPGLDDRFPRLRDGDFETGMRLVDEDGVVWVGADAVHQVARHLDGWRRLAWLYRIPPLRPLFRMVYAWVARHRHRLGPSCDDGSCEVPPPSG